LTRIFPSKYIGDNGSEKCESFRIVVFCVMSLETYQVARCHNSEDHDMALHHYLMLLYPVNAKNTVYFEDVGRRNRCNDIPVYLFDKLVSLQEK
jgi:hypothetical protein